VVFYHGLTPFPLESYTHDPGVRAQVSHVGRRVSTGWQDPARAAQFAPGCCRSSGPAGARMGSMRTGRSSARAPDLTARVLAGQQDGRILWRLSQLRRAEHGSTVLWLSELRGVAWAAACDESDDDELNLCVHALDALGACCGVEGMRALGRVWRGWGCSSARATSCDS
jgi:hypothetical protein